MVRRVREAIRRAFLTFADAVSGGAFLTRWSALLSFIVASTVSVPTIADATLQGYAAAVLVGALGWIVLSLIVLPAAAAERRLKAPRARAVVVLAALVVAALVRAPVNNAVSVLLWDTPTTGGWGPRTLTNVVTTLVVFGVVGVATTQFARRRLVAQRLSDALVLMRERLARAQERVTQTDAVLADTVIELRAGRDAMLEGRVDFDTVRAYAGQVRETSHRLAGQAEDAGALPKALAESRYAAPAGRPPWILIPTPWLVVALVYNIASLPFALTAGPPAIVGIGYLGVCLIDVTAGAVTRLPRLRGATPGSVRPAAFIGTWLLAGIGVALLTFSLFPDVRMLSVVGVVAIPAAAMALSLCVDAMRRVRSAEYRSARVLARVAQHVAARQAQAGDRLARASSLLHGRVQGRCVILAAQADDGSPSAEEIEVFRAQTDDAFDAILDRRSGPEGAPASGLAGSLDGLLSAWSGVVATTLELDTAATLALTDPATADRAIYAVNEALVNAVKHSAARVAAVAISGTTDGRVRVRVSSRGALAASAGRSAGLGTRAPGIAISQQGDDVVLDSVLPAAG
ncbi:hypothetical protein SK224_08610 [Microbacterium sp. BG28]|uniref:hypothetical protein n=1 Tax=Microbacterium sp. BG28 TaxID=3097356 RepID=UPI002A5B030C|nr:hypothetical protein [Microbacterium sp. BG28]MDY0829185.1 hypothetical protein [Microbacterium sp. BG28]